MTTTIPTTALDAINRQAAVRDRHPVSIDRTAERNPMQFLLDPTLMALDSAVDILWNAEGSLADADLEIEDSENAFVTAADREAALDLLAAIDSWTTSIRTYIESLPGTP